MNTIIVDSADAPDDVYREALLASIHTEELMQELYRRGVMPVEYEFAYGRQYALDEAHSSVRRAYDKVHN